MVRQFYRVKQVLATRKSKLSYLEVDFIRKYLTAQEQILFFRMKGFDQKHALFVAEKCLEKTKDINWIERPLMIKASLLHDVGKSSMDIGVVLRIVYVLLNTYKEGKLINNLARERSFFSIRKKLYVLKEHGSIGCKMLEGIGVVDKEVLQVIKNHHKKPDINESRMLPILRDIDSSL